MTAASDPTDYGPHRCAATRAALLEDRELTGTAWCRRYAGGGRRLARRGLRPARPAATTRGWPCWRSAATAGASWRPAATWTCCCVHDRRGRIKPVADAMWYPVWDTGLHLDHSVRTAKEVRAAMDDDIKVALGLLDARRVAGDARAWPRRCLRRALEQWQTRAGRWLPAVDEIDPGPPRALRRPGLPARARPQGGARAASGTCTCCGRSGRVVPVLAGRARRSRAWRRPARPRAGAGRAAPGHRPVDQHPAAPGPGRRRPPPCAMPTPTP